MTAELGTVILFTTRMEELAAFYQEGLGLETPFTGDHPGHLGQRVGSVYLGFDRVDEPRGTPPGAVTLWFTLDDLQGGFDRFASLGAEVRYPPTRKPWGATIASLTDPDGNVFGLAQRE